MFQCCEKEEGWERGKENRKENKGGKKKTHAMDFIKSMEKKRRTKKYDFKKKKKRNEATTERKDGVWKRVWKGNKTSTVTRKEERKRSENKKKIL